MTNGNGQRGFTLIELMVVIAVIGIIAAIAVPGLLKARMTSNEISAMASLKVTTSSQITYSASCGLGGYAPTFVVLGTPPPGTSAAFISQDLGRVAPILKTGYSFTLGAGAGSVPGPTDCNATVTNSAWLARAAPQSWGMTGTRHFATNAGNIVWQNTADLALTEPFAVTATVTPAK